MKVSTAAPAAPAADMAVQRIKVEFAGGYETDPRDRGRPAILVASALGVPPEVFREPFSHVKPAPAGQEPDPEQVRKNKAALLDGLGKYGVTNDRLDEVSNYYWYRRDRGELWKNVPAAAYALVKDGKVTGFDLTEPGAGYSSVPTVSVPGFKDAVAKVELKYGKVLKTNGAVAAITLMPVK